MKVSMTNNMAHLIYADTFHFINFGSNTFHNNFLHSDKGLISTDLAFAPKDSPQLYTPPKNHTRTYVQTLKAT